MLSADGRARVYRAINRGRYFYRAIRGSHLYRGRQLAFAYLCLLKQRKRLLGVGLALDHNDRVALRFAFEEIFINEDYRFASERDDPFIVDCGSNAGVSVAYFKKLYPKARILAFEPDPTSFASLKRNIESNDFMDVSIINAALTDREGPIDLFGTPGSDVATTVASPDVLTTRKRVEGKRLSALVSERVDLLKLDVQGAETAVLADLEEAGKLGHVQQMAIEYHHHMSPGEDMLSLILALLERNDFGYQLAAERRRSLATGRFQDVLIHCYRK